MPGIIRLLGKFNTIMIFAGLMTLCLFYTMQLLVMTDETIPVRGPVRILPKITMPGIEIIIDHETPKPEEMIEPPVIPYDRIINTFDDPPVAAIRTPLPKEVPADIGGPNVLGPLDGNAMPIAQIQPVYPARALERGIEGFVILEFDVSETGLVTNPEILVSEPAGMFDRAALHALERWKYQPRVINGKAVKMRGLQTRFSFNLRE